MQLLTVRHHQRYVSVKAGTIKLYRGKLNGRVLRRPFKRAQEASDYAAAVEARLIRLRQAAVAAEFAAVAAEVAIHADDSAQELADGLSALESAAEVTPCIQGVTA